GEEGIAVCESARPGIVLTDIRMPGMGGLAFTKQVRERWPDCPVIVITGQGDEASAIAALKAGASDYLKKPITVDDLRATVSRAMAAVQSYRTEPLVDLPVDRIDFQVVVDNAFAHIVSLINTLVRDTEPFLASRARFELRMALQEMLLNAIEHGNLEISYQEKLDAIGRDQYAELLDARCREARFRDRRVTVQVLIDRGQRRISYRIRDEGRGFDWRTQLATSAESRLLTGGAGRGIFLSRSLMPDQTYNERGNEVTLTIPLSVDGVPASSPAPDPASCRRAESGPEVAAGL
ncbi:MAG: response regulator, partial [Nitrospirae bacterium]|nr:response regulator [Nitrospirota bacterium]